MRKLGFFLLICTAVLTFIGISAKENKDIAPLFQPVIFSCLQGKQWVEHCVELHPEIIWLADVNVRKTEEGQTTLQGTYSEQLFGQKYIEFDRTIMTIHCLKLFLDGSDEAYVEFTAAQPQEIKLSRESFQILHLQGQELLQSKWQGLPTQQMALAMETALVLGDIGKSEKARELFKPYGIQAIDHDDFYGETIKLIEKCPALCPSFACLPPSAKKLLVEIANLAHYGHITHLEGGTGMFAKLKESELPFKDPTAVSFDLFVHTCDVAGALGHVNNRSSLVYTEPTHRAMQAMANAVRVLSDPNKSERDAYNTYICQRASWLGLDANDSSDRVLARIGAMLRLFSPEEGGVLKMAMNQLDASNREKISEQLDEQQPSQTGRTPTYMPAVLVNLSNNTQLGKSKEERLVAAVTIGLPFIARVLEKYQGMLASQEISPDIPLNFNKVAGVAKTSPECFNEGFIIDNEGNVHLFVENGS